MTQGKLVNLDTILIMLLEQIVTVLINELAGEMYSFLLFLL